jgi:glucose-1-phosphate thymidylyltransferase
MSRAPKALIVTAGLLEPSRFRALGVRACPLVPIANRPLVLHVLDGLRSAGVREVAVLGDGATRAEVAAVVGTGGAELAVRYVDHVDRRALDAPAIVVQPADALLTGPLQSVVGEVAAARIDGVVLRVPSVAAPPQPADAPPATAPAHVGACLLGPEAADGLGASLDADDERVGASVDALAAALVASSSRVREEEVRGCLACCDGDDGLLRANRLALEGLAPGLEGATLLDTEIQGPVLIHPTATVRSTLVRGPAVIGPGARLDDVYLGPYTAIGEDVVIEGAEIEHSLVLAGAEVRYPGVRLTTSIIGPRARLVRDFRLPRGMRVAVGADAVVALS